LSWIKTISPDEAADRLAQLYARMVDPHTGRVGNILSIQSLDPASLEAHHALYRAVMRPTRSLRGAEREMIAVVVSRTNQCHY